MADRFELFDFNATNFGSAFADMPFDGQQTFGNAPRLAPLIQSLQHVKQSGGNSILKQYPVQDPDFLAEYHAYYSRIFGDIDKHCHRFHFFTIPLIDGEKILDFIDRASTVENSYIGFITIRPVRSSPVAATILRQLPDQHFLLSSDKFTVHIAGQAFTICGTPFMQQDNAVGACAQASIWMALRTMRKKEGNSAFDPAQITGAATRFLVRGRTLPNREGLAVDQMIEVIRFAGYSPHIMRFGTGGHNKLTGAQLNSAKRKIYTYVESEIPVVLGVFPNPTAGHAIVLIGHKWDKNNNPQPYIGTSIYHAADWVPSFIAHNDNSGPYLNLPESGTDSYCFDQVDFAIPLLPSDVFMTGEESEEVASSLFHLTLSLINPPPPTGTQPIQCEKLVFRTYLVERHKYREWVTKNPDICPDLKEYYRLKVFPKRLWVTEINLLSQFNNTCSGSLARVGEIITDPTGEPNDCPFLSIHVNASALLNQQNQGGVVIDREANGKKIKLIPIQNDTPYSSLNRT